MKEYSIEWKKLNKKEKKSTVKESIKDIYKIYQNDLNEIGEREEENLLSDRYNGRQKSIKNILDYITGQRTHGHEISRPMPSAMNNKLGFDCHLTAIYTHLTS